MALKCGGKESVLYSPVISVFSEPMPLGYEFHVFLFSSPPLGVGRRLERAGDGYFPSPRSSRLG